MWMRFERAVATLIAGIAVIAIVKRGIVGKSRQAAEIKGRKRSG
jgi:hypothetical protein